MFSALDGLIWNCFCQLGVFKLRRGALRWNWNPYWELAVCSLHNSVLQPDFHSVQHQCVSSRASSIKLKSVLRTCSVLNGWWKRAFYESNLFKSIQWKRGEGGWWKTSSWSLAVPIWIGDIMAAATSADLLHVFPHGHALNKVFGSFEVNCIEAPKERNNLKGWNNWKEGRFWKYRP